MPTVDAYVEAITPSTSAPFFLAQVKTSTRGYTVREGRLKLSVSSEHLRRLAAHAAPTYLVGIDEPNEEGYIVSANGESAVGFSSMCTDHPLDADVIAALHSEVTSYWADPSAGVNSALVDQKRERD